MSCILSTVKPEVQLWDGDLSRRTKADGSSSCKRITFSDSLNISEYAIMINNDFLKALALRHCVTASAWLCVPPSTTFQAVFQWQSIRGTRWLGARPLPALTFPFPSSPSSPVRLSVPGCLFYLCGSSSQNMRCFETHYDALPWIKVPRSKASKPGIQKQGTLKSMKLDPATIRSRRSRNMSKSHEISLHLENTAKEAAWPVPWLENVAVPMQCQASIILDV